MNHETGVLEAGQIPRGNRARAQQNGPRSQRRSRQPRRHRRAPVRRRHLRSSQAERDAVPHAERRARSGTSSGPVDGRAVRIASSACAIRDGPAARHTRATARARRADAALFVGGRGHEAGARYHGTTPGQVGGARAQARQFSGSGLRSAVARRASRDAPFTSPSVAVIFSIAARWLRQLLALRAAAPPVRRAGGPDPCTTFVSTATASIGDRLLRSLFGDSCGRPRR